MEGLCLKDLTCLSEATFDFNVYPYHWTENDKVVALRTVNGIFNAFSTSIFLLGFSRWSSSSLLALYTHTHIFIHTHTHTHLLTYIHTRFECDYSGPHIWKAGENSIQGQSETCHCKDRDRLLRHSNPGFLIADLFRNGAPDCKFISKDPSEFNFVPSWLSLLQNCLSNSGIYACWILYLRF